MRQPKPCTSPKTEPRRRTHPREPSHVRPQSEDRDLSWAAKIAVKRTCLPRNSSRIPRRRLRKRTEGDKARLPANRSTPPPQSHPSQLGISPSASARRHPTKEHPTSQSEHANNSDDDGRIELSSNSASSHWPRGASNTRATYERPPIVCQGTLFNSREPLRKTETTAETTTVVSRPDERLIQLVSLGTD
jgi:hypothetical protein